MTTKPEQCCNEPRGFVGGVCDYCDGTVQPEYFYWERMMSDNRAFANYKMRDTNFTARVKFDGDFLIEGDDNRASLLIRDNRLSGDLDWIIDALTELREIAKEIITE